MSNTGWVVEWRWRSWVFGFTFGPEVYLLQVGPFSVGFPVWWMEYTAWRLGFCWIGHPLRRADENCDRFWDAERLLLEHERHPDRFEFAVLTAPPLTCIRGNTTSASSSFVVQCGCDRCVWVTGENP